MFQKSFEFLFKPEWKNDKKFGDILNLYNYYEKEKGNNNEINKIHPVEGDAEEIVTDDLNNEKAFKIDKNFAFEFLLNNKFNSENISSEIEKKLDEINTRKKYILVNMLILSRMDVTNYWTMKKMKIKMT